MTDFWDALRRASDKQLESHKDPYEHCWQIADAAMNEQRINDENLDAWKRRVQQNATNPAVVTDLRDALLRIVGDKPASHEDPYERCRQIAADALGYPAPAPMQESNLMAALQQAACNTRSWNPYDKGMPDARVTEENIELVPHGELMALKERDEARAEIMALKAELVILRSRVSERDASIVNAIRTGRSFRHV